MDFDGKTKDIYTINHKEYAINYFSPASSYMVIKIENILSNDSPSTFEKRYTPLINESRINGNMMSKLFKVALSEYSCLLTHIFIFIKRNVGNIK